MSISVFAAVLYALAQSFDAGNRTLFDSIIFFFSTAETRILIDIYCLLQAFRRFGWVCSQHNIEDAFAKNLNGS